MTNAVATIKNLWDVATNFRSIMRDREQKRRAEQDDERLPSVIQMMDETEQTVRKNHNVPAYSPVFDDEEWWAKNLPGVPRKLIRRGMEQREKKRERLAKLWPR